MLKVVRATGKDATKLAEISKQAFENDVQYGAPGPGGPPGYDSAAWQSKMMRLGEYYKIDIDGEIIGGLIVFRKQPREYEVGRIFLAPPFQNHGFGRQVFEFLWAAYPLVKRWTLDTPQWNVRNRHFYQSVGFREIGTDREGGVLFERCLKADIAGDRVVY